MGIFKIAAFVLTPIAGMTWAAFSLGKQLPKASRLFGNYIGLSYVYFKSILRVLKPRDHLPFQAINKARQASQQADALRRELRNTITKAKQQFRTKQQQTFRDFEQDLNQKVGNKIQQSIPKKMHLNPNNNQNDIFKQRNQHSVNIIQQIQRQREQMLRRKIQKVKSQKFYKQI